MSGATIDAGAAGDAEELAHAFARAVPAGGRRCDRPDCPADALRRVDLFGQDFYFCLHHWDEQRRRLPAPWPEELLAHRPQTESVGEEGRVGDAQVNVRA